MRILTGRILTSLAMPLIPNKLFCAAIIPAQHVPCVQLGVPIIVTDYPTVRDQIIDGSEGIIVPMTPEGIAEGIQSVITSNDKMRSLKSYLTSHEYGNQDEIQKYYNVLLGE